MVTPVGRLKELGDTLALLRALVVEGKALQRGQGTIAVHQLRLVCHKFNDVFKSYSTLFQVEGWHQYSAA